MPARNPSLTDSESALREMVQNERERQSMKLPAALPSDATVAMQTKKINEVVQFIKEYSGANER